MKHFDPIKDKLREANELPDDLSWDNMKDGIYGKMDSSVIIKEESKDRKKFLFILLFLFALSLGYFIINQYKTSPTLITDQNKNLELTKNKTTAEQNKKEQIEQSTTVSNNEVNEPTLQRKKELNTTKTKTNSIAKKTRDLSVVEALNSASKNKTAGINISEENKAKLTTSDNVFNTPDNKNTKESIAPLKQEKTTHVSLAQNTIDPSLNKTSSRGSFEDSRINQDIANIESLHLIPFEIPLNQENLVMSKAEVRQSPVSKNIASKIQWSMSLGSGLNLMNSNYGSSIQGDALSKIESNSVGYSASFRIDAQKGKWFVASGLEWKSTYRLTETLLVNSNQEEHNVLVSVINNPFSGTQEIHENRLIEIIDSTNFRHHNQFNSWSIPMIVGYKKECRGLYYKVGLGANAIFSQSQNGVTVRNNRHQIYDENNDLFKSGFGLAVIGEVELGFVIKSKMNIGLRLNYNRYLSNLSNQSTLSMKPNIYNSEFTLGYRF